MRKRRFVLFLILNALAGVFIARGLLFAILLPYPGKSLMVVGALSLSLLFFYRNLVQWVLEARVNGFVGDVQEAQSQVTRVTNTEKRFTVATKVKGTPVEDAYLSVLEYISENESTPFFKTKLQSLLQSIEDFQDRCESLDALLKDKFVEGAQSYEKFMSPVNLVRGKLTANSSALVHNLWHFDEGSYARKIESLRETGDEVEAGRYEVVEQEYKSEICNLIEEFDKTNLQLDRLILEIGRLGGLDSEANLAEIDGLIEDIKLCR